MFGILAIVAALVEMTLTGFDGLSIAGAVKDISGTMLAVMVLLFAVRRLIPKAKTVKFENRLKDALDKWESDNSTLIVKSSLVEDEKTNSFGFHLRTDVREFYNESALSKNSGWFIRLPQLTKNNYDKPGIQIKFHLNKGTFFNDLTLSKEELVHYFATLNNQFCNYINRKYNDILSVSGSGEDTFYLQ